MTVAVGLILISLFSCIPGNPVSVCLPNHSCLPIPECQINLEDVVYPCEDGRNICCLKPKYQKFSSKNANQIELKNSSEFTTESNKKDKWKNPGKEETKNEFHEIQEFLRNASLSGFISNRPIFNQNPNDPKGSTHTPFTAGSFEHVRLNIPDYSPEFDRTDLQGTENYETTRRVAEEENNFSVISRRKPFKENCGLTFADNKVTGGKIAEIGQFPWMALLAFRQAVQPEPQFLCGGTLITTRHVLTAAHCIMENRPLELVFVRLGEYNLTSQRDCVSFGNRVVCADQHTDVYVDHVTIHPEYNRKTLKNDIAVIRLKYDVRESDYIRAICLPFNKNWSYSELTGQNFTVSGWGKSESGNLFGSDILQYAKVTIWDQHKCNSSIPTQVKPLSETQLCANGLNTEDACKGDSGGPLMNITLDKSLEVRHIQFGIVSFGTATCGDKNLPTIYTRVDQYLKWIVETVT